MQSNIQLIDTVVYAGRLKDREQLLMSSSGGAFTAISDVFLNRGEAVVCSIYNYERHSMEYQLITTVEDRDKARGSKYMQSRAGNIYRECVDWLKRNTDKRLIFIGMRCQADGFRKYIEAIGMRERVYIIDIICYGASSPKLWREYIQSLERKYHGNAANITFKDKRNGWKSPTAIASINGEEISLKEYMRIYYSRSTLRPSCHICLYASTEGKTDMTIGDYWHIERTIPEFYDSDGNSLFLIHTNRGLELFDNLKRSLNYRRSNVKDCWQKNLDNPTPVSSRRTEFWKDYRKYGIEYIMKKYGTMTLRAKVKNKIKQYWGGV